ncbi:hypothetical protein [uncultured Parolsenella sp.]|uniref:hypothetical protein n=1 Tax=uncultured Parolsenella sp. TaxID=2083008 RepID=UPI0027D981FF|nr:hypothetical protein [uncultured Parolsenella sp.]
MSDNDINANVSDASAPIVIPPTGPGAPVPAADGPSPIEGRLRKAPLRVPDIYEACSGFTLFGRRIRSLLYSTDVAVIRNSNADAIFAVYPFTAQPAITQALLTVAEAPLFVGVGGGTTTGRRAAELAAVSEMQGAAGVVLNSPATTEMVAQIATTVDIPVVATITKFDDLAAEKVYAGARIVNVAAGRNTAAVIAELRAAFPNLPIIATGGHDATTAQATVSAGANALIWAPPSVVQLQKDMMVRYRAGKGAHDEDEAAPAATPVPATPDITDMPVAAIPHVPDPTDMPVVADVPVGVVSTVPPEAEAAPVVTKGFVSPFHGRLPRLRRKS